MNLDAFYSCVTICACGGLFLVWELGFRELFLEDFRDSLFVVRKRLYALSQEGRINCDSKAYRSVESLLNGVIRYAHRFTFVAMVLSLREMHRRASNGPDFTAELKGQVDTISDAQVRRELNAIMVETSTLMAKYIAKSSVCMRLTLLFFKVKKRPDPEQRAINNFEREAYLAYQADGREPVAA